MHERFEALKTTEAPTASAHVTAPELELQLIELFAEKVPTTTTALAGNAAKELQVAERFAALSVIEAFHLHKRLSIAAASDPLASAFRRFTIERRQRLLAFLEGARRRAALASPKSRAA